MESKNLVDCYFSFFVSVFCLLLLVVSSVWVASSFTVFDLGLVFMLQADVDSKSLFFIFSLAIITSVVAWFGETYVSQESNKTGFWLVLLGFVGGMSILILAKDFLSLLVGWETLGITSYLLVAFYMSSVASNGAMKTVLFNRVGDVFFVAAMALLPLESTWSFFFIVFMFSICKSAQFPFSAWLPAAMAAPTPISALVHSSTLVTAGLWLLTKFSVGGVLMIVLGSITMFFGAFSALVESDLKKVVAFSTLSQLGLLMFSLGAFVKEEAFFHLITHAYFKSILFIAVGYWILLSSHNQQASFMSSPTALIQLVCGVSLLSMSGGIFFAGFFSKHSIVGLTSDSLLSWAFFFTLALGSIFTALYSARLASSLFKTKENQLVFPAQFTIGLFSLLGGFVVSKFLFPEADFLAGNTSWFSFVFLVWGIWGFLTLLDSSMMSTIFFSSFVTSKESNLSLVSPTIDSLSKNFSYQKFMVPSGLETGFVLGMLMVVALCIFI